MSKVELLLDELKIEGGKFGQFCIACETPNLDIEDLLCQLEDDDLKIVGNWMIDNASEFIEKKE